MDRKAAVAETWLRHETASADASLIDRLIRYNAENGWRAVLLLHRLSLPTPSPVNFAGRFGPLERLLHHHGDVVGDRVIELARRDAEFRARLAPLADVETIPAALIDAIGAVCGWQRRARARRPNATIDQAVSMAEVDIEPPTTDEDWRLIDRTRSDAELAALASSWLEREDTAWAFGDVVDLIQSSDVPAAWNLILDLVRGAATNGQLGAIGAGPIEDFLGLNGEAWIARVEQEARTNSKFCYALAWSWRSGMSEAVWERVQAASAPGRDHRYFPEPPN